MNHQPVLPDDIRQTAERLRALAEAERHAGAACADRIAARTSPSLAAEPPQPRALKAWWARAALPALAAAAVLLGVFLVPGLRPTGPGAEAPAEVLSASIESDLDALVALESIWNDDGFETGLATISLDAAGVASQADDTLATLGSEL
jgi:hypothetical protein